MSQSEENGRESGENIIDYNLINYIMQRRIYDMLCLIATETNETKAGIVINMHKQGRFIGPPPAIIDEE